MQLILQDRKSHGKQAGITRLHIWNVFVNYPPVTTITTSELIEN